MHRLLDHAAWAAALTTSALLLTACSSPAGEADTADAGSSLSYRDADGTCPAGAGSDEATQAEAFLEPFLRGPDGLLVTDPLPQPVSPDTTVAYLNNGTVIAGLMQGYLETATATAGVQFQNVDTGADADSINSALNSVVESSPDIVISAALDATFFSDQLERLEGAGTTVVYVGAVNADDFGLRDSVGGRGASEVNGQVLAASAQYFTCGTGRDFVFYNIPEFAFSQVQLDAATAYLEESCPDCTLRTVDISILDPSPADKIVSDLQAHPETQFFITPGDQFQIGLAQKAQLAGITNARGIGQSSIAPNIAQVAAGEQTAGFAVDYAMYIWTALDEGFRVHQGGSASYDDWSQVVQSMSRVITPQDAGDYATEAGFVADPAMADDFGALWR